MLCSSNIRSDGCSHLYVNIYINPSPFEFWDYVLFILMSPLILVVQKSCLSKNDLCWKTGLTLKGKTIETPDIYTMENVVSELLSLKEVARAC